MYKKYQFLIKIPNIGIMKYSTKEKQLNVKHNSRFNAALTKFFKKYGLTTLEYINLYIMPLQTCGFCNKNLAIYDYDLEIFNDTLIIKNVHIQKNYMCNNKTCKDNRKKLNPNSLEHISKRKKISLEQADKWQKANNNSPFYLHPGQSIEDYSKRQSRSIDYFIKKYGEAGNDKFKNYCKKISKANSKQEVIKKYGEQYY